ncbi:hypothetical protein [Kitasatospora sp. NPDC059571]|uniref:hypothetical protein n=1 Tax=Kitasatospora sp. NPDC059571 TaxID=3346871 RepID=UPI00368D0725
MASFLGEANLLEGRLSADCADTALGPLPLTSTAGTGPATVLLRPHQLRLTTAAGPNTVRVSLRGQSFRGHDYRLELTPTPGQGLPEQLIAYSHTAPPGGDAPLFVEALGMVHPVTDA